MTPAGGSHGKLHRTTKILSHASRQRDRMAARGARAVGENASDRLAKHEVAIRKGRAWEESRMKKFVSGIVVSPLILAAILSQDGFAQITNVTEAEAKMFAASAGYERFMGRWSRLLAPAYITFAGVKDGDRVLDVGTGTGSLAAAVEASMPASEIVGVDPSE